ncbi:hypothetical protein LX36DRAFT_379083 [Colletotrichum falcatum]|nr:hypothetical protein LX36DRAFT_379083 [Colletotrichum falcatum]
MRDLLCQAFNEALYLFQEVPSSVSPHQKRAMTTSHLHRPRKIPRTTPGPTSPRLPANSTLSSLQFRAGFESPSSDPGVLLQLDAKTQALVDSYSKKENCCDINRPEISAVTPMSRRRKHGCYAGEFPRNSQVFDRFPTKRS